jgi:mercuric ion binding protein
MPVQFPVYPFFINLLFQKLFIMKTFKIFSIAALLMIFSGTAIAQEKTETFKVSGNCGMCKTKIEKAAKEAGAKEASWDVDAKQLTVTYKSKSTNAAKIQQKVAEVGYDNVGFKATAEAYNKLHGCCKYERETAIAEVTSEMECCKDGKCTMAGHDGKDCCKKGEGEAKCTMAGHDGKDCCSKKTDAKMDCCKDGKCTKEGHDGKDCCKKSDK